MGKQVTLSDPQFESNERDRSPLLCLCQRHASLLVNSSHTTAMSFVWPCLVICVSECADDFRRGLFSYAFSNDVAV